MFIDNMWSETLIQKTISMDDMWLKNITMEDYGDRHHIINIIVMQQQLRDSESAEKLNIIDR